MKLKKCKICKQEFEPKNKFQLVCSYTCANKYAKLHLKKEAENKWKQEKKVLKEKVKTITQLRNEVRVVFQKYIRMRDANECCISCGASVSKIWDASHFYPATPFTGLIFDEQNVHKSCRYCNTYLHGNLIAYGLGLIKRYGIEYKLQLDNKALQGRYKKYTREELNEIKSIYINKLKTIKP